VKQHKCSFILVTILKMRAFRAGPLKQNQRLASRPQADAIVKSLCKGGSWAKLGSTVFPTSPAEFGKFVADETEKWAKGIQAANIKL
jgi:hypothetical protein